MTLPTNKSTAAQLRRAQFAREIVCPDKRYWCEGDNAAIQVYAQYAGTMQPMFFGWDHDGRMWWSQSQGQPAAGRDENGNWLPDIVGTLRSIEIAPYLTEKTTTLSMQRWRQKVRGDWLRAKAPTNTLMLPSLVRGSPAVYRVEHTPFGIFAYVWRVKINNELEFKQHPMLPDYPGDDTLSALIGGVRYTMSQDKKTLLRSGITDPNGPQEMTGEEPHRRFDHPERPELSRLIPGRNAWYTISPAPNGRLKLIVAWPDTSGRVRRVSPSIGEDGAFVFCDRSYKLNSLGEVVKNDRY